MDITAYLNRINYHGSLEPTSETLQALHLAHMLAVPFENLDIGLGRPIVLDQPALFDKIVERRRGGFCYELNGLFAGLLRALGFGVTMLAAGVARDDGGFGPEFDHLTLLVTTKDLRTTAQRTHNKEQSRDPSATVDDPQSAIYNLRSAIGWLADVGFGDSFREPLRFEMLAEQPQDGLVYQIAPDAEALILRQRDGEDEWEPLYRFTQRPRQHADFTDMCHYHQSSPQSSFTQRRICTRATPKGRITLSDMRLIVTANGERQEQLLTNEQEYQAALRDYFGIDLGIEDRG